jgi:hypothetical protein
VNPSKSQNPWIAGLTSFALHLVLLLVLAIWTVTGSGRGGRLSVDSTGSDFDEATLDSVVIESASDTNDQPGQSGLGPSEVNSSLLQADLKPSPLPLSGLESPKPQSISESIRSSGTEGHGSATIFINSSFEGRSAKNRLATGAKNGSSAPSEEAVDAALAYLARHQQNNGSWTIRLIDGPCKGQCDHGGEELDPHDIAATGLALLCFLGRGHTLHEGEYSEQVSRGVYFLVQNLKSQSGRGTWLTTTNQRWMYEHGIATLALCEALQMKGDEALLTKPCQEAIAHIVHAQFHDGSWGYQPNQPGDLSIMGWQVLALKSAHGAKLAVNAETIRNVDIFLKKHNRNDFMFYYRDQANKPTASMTSIGTLLRIFRGWSRTDPAIIKAVEYLVKEGPSTVDPYYNYYATQVLFQFGGKPWVDWNERQRDFLVSAQEKEGHMAGSWWFQTAKATPAGIANEAGGRLYVTAMTCLTLEVYYRYLPVNEAVTHDFQF